MLDGSIMHQLALPDIGKQSGFGSISHLGILVFKTGLN